MNAVYYYGMAIYPLLTLLAQAMVAMFFALPFIFGALACGVYIVLILVNTGFAVVNGYRRKPPQLLLTRRAMVIVALAVAAMVCIGALFSIDGRFT
jgi:uncharacterized membrane protein